MAKEEPRPPVFSIRTKIVGLGEKVQVSKPQINLENDSSECSNDEQGQDMVLDPQTMTVDMVALFAYGICAAAFLKATARFLHLPLSKPHQDSMIGVDEKEDEQLFYYLIESERNPRDDPLLLLLTGGPTCSGLCELVFEIGPIKFNMVEYNGSLPTFALIPYSWTKVSSILFVDAPIGTGFSYSRSTQGSSDILFVDHMYSFLTKWLICHPEFISIPFYIGGDSFCGMIIPVLAEVI
ncbi:serine carboxypeptidase-like 7 [Pyrus communis]|uniref:serine carboxypeptidase-like 7 n=1 Tax=Pyrus communis TaxID=23211 RepID=UPI0035BFEFB3